jgi:hypothetical protein
LIRTKVEEGRDAATSLPREKLPVVRVKECWDSTEKEYEMTALL